MTLRGTFPDQEENQFSSIRVGAACIMVSTSSIPQLTLEALAGVRMELPGRHSCGRLRSLSRTSLPGGADFEVAESPRWPSWRERGVGNMDRVPVRRGTMDPSEKLHRSKRFSDVDETRPAY